MFRRVLCIKKNYQNQITHFRSKFKFCLKKLKPSAQNQQNRVVQRFFFSFAFNDNCKDIKKNLQKHLILIFLFQRHTPIDTIQDTYDLNRGKSFSNDSTAAYRKHVSESLLAILADYYGDELTNGRLYSENLRITIKFTKK